MAKSPYSVKVEQGAAKGKKYNLKKDALVLGSDESADIVLQGRGVAPQHAQLVFEAGRVLLKDLGSEAGTFRNGQRLLGPVQVFPGDRIGLGPEVILILDGDSTAVEREKADEAVESLSGDLGMASDGPP